MITLENWSHTQYKNGELKVQITFGAEPETPEQIDYFVTMMDVDHKEVFQHGPMDLESAVNKINKQYKAWPFMDHLEKDSEGCSTCSAH